VLDPDHRHVDHRLVVSEQILDLTREDVLAAGDDHLVVAAIDEEATTGVEMADVATAEQPVDRLFAAASSIALEGHLVADEDPADLTPRDLAPVLVVEAHHRATWRPAGGPWRCPQVLRGGDGRV